MNLRATGILLAIALVLGLWVRFGDFGDGSGGASAERLVPLEADEIVALEVPLKGGGNARLVRALGPTPGRTDAVGVAGAWALESPLAFPAAPDVIADLLRGVTGLESVDRLDDVDDRAPFGIDASSRTVAVEGGDRTITLQIGKATPFGGNLYVGLEGDDGLYTAPSWKLDQLERELRALRDARMLKLAGEDVDALRIEIGGRPLAAAKRLDDGWVLTEPFPEPADQGRITRLLEDFDLARAVDFVDEPGPLSQYGLERPEVVVELNPGTENGARIEMGSAGDDRYLRIDGAGPIFAIAPRIADGVPREVFTLRDKLVLQVGEDEVQRVSLQFPREDERYAFKRTDEGWQPDGHEVGVDTSRLDDLLYALSELEAVEIPAPDAEAPAFGLEPASVRVELEGKKGELGWLELGDSKPGSGIGARSSQKQRLWIVDAAVAASVPLGAEAFRNTWLAASGSSDGENVE